VLKSHALTVLSVTVQDICE